MSPLPNNYILDVKNPFEEAIKGYQTGLAIRQQQQQMQEYEAAKANAKALQSDLLALSMNKNASADDYSAMMAKYPSLSESLKRSWDTKTEAQQRRDFSDAAESFAALTLGNADVVKSKFQAQKQASLNSGDQAGADKADAMLKLLEANPESVRSSMGMALIAAAGPERFKEIFTAINPSQEESYTQLTDAQKKSYGLPLDQSFQMDSKGKISQVGGDGTKVSVNVDSAGKLGTIPPGYVAKQSNGEYVMEPIPGGPVDIENKKKAIQAQEASVLEKRAGEVVLFNISRLQKMIDKSSLFQPVAGSKRGILPDALNQAKVDAEQVKQSIVSNIGFDRLQQMRKASPTGGALGDVTKQELDTLQSVLGSLSLDQSPQQLQENLSNLKNIYGEIMKKASAYPNAVDYGFSSNDTKRTTGNEKIGTINMNKLNALQKQLGRKFNSDEIKALKQAGKL